MRQFSLPLTFDAFKILYQLYQGSFGMALLFLFFNASLKYRSNYRSTWQGHLPTALPSRGWEKGLQLCNVLSFPSQNLAWASMSRHLHVLPLLTRSFILIP